MSSNEKKVSLNKEILKELRVSSQENMLLNCMDQFYCNSENSKNLLDVINGHISIRLIDFFVTNYSKKNRVNYPIKSENNNSLFNVYSSYKSQLKAWNKKYFDPFSRGDRVPFFINDECIITTIGQLNFFKWYISNKIFVFVKNNIDKIELEMNKNKKKIKKEIKTVRPKKKAKDNRVSKNYNLVPLSLTGPKKITKIEVTFD